MALTTKQWHKIATTTVGVTLAVLTMLFGLAAWVVEGIAGDVETNTEHRQQEEGAKVVERLEQVEKGLIQVKGNQVALYYEERIDRALMNRIAKSLNVDEAPAVEPLPEESE